MINVPLEKGDALEIYKDLFHFNPYKIFDIDFDVEDIRREHEKQNHSNKCENEECDFESNIQKGLMLHNGVKHKYSACSYFA